MKERERSIVRVSALAPLGERAEVRVSTLRNVQTPGGGLAGWSLYICDEVNDERRRTVGCESLSPRPLGGEGGPPPALSPAGAGRVRGSNP